MKASVSQKIKIGVFTVAGILLLLAGIFLIGSKKNMFGNTFMIYGTFKNVGGLNVGNNIRFAGINVGTVEKISIVSDTLIRVDMLMKNEVKPFLKTDALATIGSDGLMGDKLITINAGSANEIKIHSSGSRIMTADPVDFDKVITKLTNVADNAEIISSELAGMAIQIREGNGTISQLLYSDKLSRSLEGTANNAQQITGSMAGIAAHIRTGKGSLGSLIYTDSLSNTINNTVNSANTALTSANTALVTIEQAADGFSENMKALQGNILFRGYFRKKARDEAANPSIIPVNITDDLAANLTEEELQEIIADAQKALDAKKKNNTVIVPAP